MSMQMDGDAMEQQGAVASQGSPVLPCAGCGGLVPDVPGPAHPYMRASPGCWQVYGEAVARWSAEPLTCPARWHHGRQHLPGLWFDRLPACRSSVGSRAGAAYCVRRLLVPVRELLLRSYTDADYRSVHQLVVDAYAAQYAATIRAWNAYALSRG